MTKVHSMAVNILVDTGIKGRDDLQLQTSLLRLMVLHSIDSLQIILLFKIYIYTKYTVSLHIRQLDAVTPAMDRQHTAALH